jgi:hypothetical protein
VTVLNLVFHDGESRAEREVEVRTFIIAGWTGRDREALEKHIRELEAMGVQRPASVPVYYRVAAARLTTSDEIEVPGTASSGEVEFVMLKQDGVLWVGVGSDHTDRVAEAYNVTISKQMCEKPIAPEFWRFDEVAPHWDSLSLRSFATQNGVRRLYQEGKVTAMRAPLDLMEGYGASDAFTDGTLMFCGTVAARGGIRPAERFDFELEDRVKGRTLRHGYTIRTLPVAG